MAAKDDRPPITINRRRLLQTTGIVAAATAFSARQGSPAHAHGPGLTMSDLGPGVVSFPFMSGSVTGDTIYLGSRDLAPSRVAAFHVPTGQVTQNFTLGNGEYVEGLFPDGQGGLYAGVTHADGINLYRCDLETGTVHEAAAVPGLRIRDVSVAPDGIVHVTGTPSPSTASQVYSYDPQSGEVKDLGRPVPDADQGSQIAATDTTIYLGANSPRSSQTGRGLYAIDRASGEVEYLRDNFAGLAILDGLLVVGGPVSILDLASNKWTELDLDAAAFATTETHLIACGEEGRLTQIDRTTLQSTALGDAALETSWGILGVVDDQVVGALARGAVWTFDVSDGSSKAYELADAGAEAGAQLVQGVAVGNGRTYVSGDRAVAVHQPDGSVLNLDVPGEAKDMAVVDGVAYMPMYNGHGLWAHRPGAPARQVAEFPPQQNRPWVVRWDPVNELLAIGIQSDKTGGGSLCLFDPATQTIEAHVNPLGDQAISALAASEGTLYIGGTTDPRNTGDIAAWDPVAGRQIWRMRQPLGADGVSSLVVVDGMLVGTTLRGPKLFVVDLTQSEPKIIQLTDVSDVLSENPNLTVDGNRILGVTASRPDGAGALFQVVAGGPGYEVEPLTYLDGEWAGIPKLAIDDRHLLYTLTGRNLTRIQMPWRRLHPAWVGPENGDFTAGRPSGPIPHWTVRYGTREAFTVTADATGARGRTLQVVDRSDTDVAGLLSDPFTVAAGRTYAFLARARGRSTSPSLYVYFHDADGHQVAEASQSFGIDTDDWQNIGLTATAPDTATSAAVMIYSSKSSHGTFWIDSVRTTPGVDP